MTELDELKLKPASELTFVESAILAAEKAGNINLAYRAAVELAASQQETRDALAVVEAATQMLTEIADEGLVEGGRVFLARRALGILAALRTGEREG
jgi:hypothetical protein